MSTPPTKKTVKWITNIHRPALSFLNNKIYKINKKFIEFDLLDIKL